MVLLFADDLPIRPDDARAGRHFIFDSVRRCGLVPILQFLTIGCEEAQYHNRVEAADEDGLEAPAGRFDSERVRIVVALEVYDAVEQYPYLNPIGPIRPGLVRAFVERLRCHSPKARYIHQLVSDAGTVGWSRQEVVRPKHKRNKRMRVSIGAPWKRSSMLAMSQLGHYVNRRNVQAAVFAGLALFFSAGGVEVLGVIRIGNNRTADLFHMTDRVSVTRQE